MHRGKELFGSERKLFLAAVHVQQAVDPSNIHAIHDFQFVLVRFVDLNYIIQLLALIMFRLPNLLFKGLRIYS